eukprot:2373366-Rhodomonas_salina.1
MRFVAFDFGFHRSLTSRASGPSLSCETELFGAVSSGGGQRERGPLRAADKTAHAYLRSTVCAITESQVTMTMTRSRASERRVTASAGVLTVTECDQHHRHHLDPFLTTPGLTSLDPHRDPG